MDKALLVLDHAKKIKTKALWRSDVYYTAVRHGMPLPPHLVIDVQKLKFDSHTVTHVLPFLDRDVFDDYMQYIGAFLWKSAEQEHLNETEAKQVVLAVLERPSLDHLLMAYLTLWEEDRDHFPHHLYCLGLGCWLRLTHKNLSSKTLYYKQLSPNAIVFVSPIFPKLRHTHSYAFNPDNFVPVTDHMETKPMLPQHQILPENLFFAKMTFIAVRIKQRRWCEAFAQALSAMDDFQHSFGCYHDLMCFVALSAGKTSLSESLIFRVLEEAKTFACEIEHDWQRMLVLHALSIHWGYFELEQDIYEYCYTIIGARTDYHHQLLQQRMDSLMRQCENIDLFLKARRKYHSKCMQSTPSRYCTLSVIFEFSYLKMDELLREMESILPGMVQPGEKEFYLAIIHHYKTHKATQEVDTIDIFHRQIGSKYFSIASKLLKPGDPRVKICGMLHKVSDHGTDPDNIMKTLEQAQVTKYTPEIADMWVQVALLNMSYNNAHFMGGGRILQHLTDAHRRATHNNGYRKYILQAAHTLQKDEGFVHVFHPNVPDYPDAHDCFGREERQGNLAKWFWQQEKEKYERIMQNQLDGYEATRVKLNLMKCCPDAHSSMTSQSSSKQPVLVNFVALPPPNTFQEQDAILSHTRDNAENNAQEEDEEEEEVEIDDDDEDDRDTVVTEVDDDEDNNNENPSAVSSEPADASQPHNSIHSMAQFVHALPLPVYTRQPSQVNLDHHHSPLPPAAPPTSPTIDLRAGGSSGGDEFSVDPNPPKKGRFGPCVEELLTSRDILELDSLAEEVYAFGCHLIKLLAE